MSAASGSCQLPAGSIGRPPRMISVVPVGIGNGDMEVTERWLLEGDAFFSRRQKTGGVNFGQLRGARQAECLSDLGDVLREAIPVIGADAVLVRDRRDDL